VSQPRPLPLTKKYIETSNLFILPVGGNDLVVKRNDCLTLTFARHSNLVPSMPILLGSHINTMLVFSVSD
jgi:hypothetical protein